MEITSKEIYESILFRAADEWGIDSDDIDRDIAQRFDPIVRFLAGACASELEQVYQYINRSEMRIQERLVRILLPEHLHLPKPAHALIKCDAISEDIIVNETTGFQIKDDDSVREVNFSPVFETRILPVKLEFLATNHDVINLNKRAASKLKSKEESVIEFSKLLIGFSISGEVNDWIGASLYFDLLNNQKDPNDKSKFFANLKGVKCYLNGKYIFTETGLSKVDYILEDSVNGNEKLHQEVRTRYERQFLRFASTPEQWDSTQLYTIGDKLKNWMQDAKDEMVFNEYPDTALHWIEIHFPQSMIFDQFEKRISVLFNVFPALNRKLCGAANGEHHYMNSSTLKWIHLQPKDSFLAIRRVYEEKPPEFKVFLYKPFSEFKEEKLPSYTIRHGGVGRWDELNAWQRLSYVLSVLQENFSHQEILNKSADALSLEELHQLLKKKIENSKEEKKPDKDIYVLLHSGLQGNLRVRLEYWTSIGAEGNGIYANQKLNCITKESISLQSNSIFTLSETEGGRNALNGTEELDALKTALLSRGKIVTREDLKMFCKDFLSDKINNLEIMESVGSDIKFGDGIMRILIVLLTINPKYNKLDWEGICQQMELLIFQKSTNTIPIKVLVKS